MLLNILFIFCFCKLFFFLMIRLILFEYFMNVLEMGEFDVVLIRVVFNEVFREFRILIDVEGIESFKKIQYFIMGRLQDSNVVLFYFNDYFENCYVDVMIDFFRNIRLLKSMKADFDYIFFKLRSMKVKILVIYFDVFFNEVSEVLDTRLDFEMFGSGWIR